jgi:hypothetical protein
MRGLWPWTRHRAAAVEPYERPLPILNNWQSSALIVADLISTLHRHIADVTVTCLAGQDVHFRTEQVGGQSTTNNVLAMRRLGKKGRFCRLCLVNSVRMIQ